MDLNSTSRSERGVNAERPLPAAQWNFMFLVTTMPRKPRPEESQKETSFDMSDDGTMLSSRPSLMGMASDLVSDPSIDFARTRRSTWFVRQSSPSSDPCSAGTESSVNSSVGKMSLRRSMQEVRRSFVKMPRIVSVREAKSTGGEFALSSEL